MVLFKYSTRKEKLSLVGVWVPPQIRDYMVLYSLVYDTNKALILREVLTKWMETKQKDSPEEELIKELRSVVKMHWEAERRENVDANYKTFLQSLRHRLEKHQLTKAYIDQILAEEED